MIGGPSSKYGYNPEQLDIDVADKMEVRDRFIKDINRAIDKEYKYRDKGCLSENWKLQILLDIYKARYM